MDENKAFVWIIGIIVLAIVIGSVADNFNKKTNPKVDAFKACIEQIKDADKCKDTVNKIYW